MLAAKVPLEDGPVMAASPALLEFVRTIAKRDDLLGAQAREELKLFDLPLSNA